MRLEDVENEITALGVRIVDGKPDNGDWATYNHDSRAILIDPVLTGNQRLATLLHELEHAKAEHDGHQNARIEAAINEKVARRLITFHDYQRAEKLYPADMQAMATELDVPVFILTAYQTYLERRTLR